MKVERRRAKRKSSTLGQIALIDQTIQCRVISSSEAGALLHVDHTMSLPREFILIVEGRSRLCHQLHRVGGDIEVEF